MERLSDILKTVDMSYALDREGVIFKETYGRSGQQLNIKECPECGNSKWKVYINAETGVGNCFVCEKRYTKYEMLKSLTDLSGRSLMEYIKTVASESGWRPKIEYRKTEVNLNTEVILPDSKELPLDGKNNLKYLSRRGIGNDIASYFNLRYCTKGWYKYLWSNQEKFQLYMKRVIIPVFDLEGNLVSFQGRDITGEAERKYLFPPGLASTGKYLYNGHNAVRSKRIVIAEGAFDVFAIKMAFDQSETLTDVVPVATFGKNLSQSEGGQLDEFIKLKRLGLKEATLMWDSEPAAVKAAVKAAMMLSGVGIKTRLAILPQGKDPNEVEPDVVIKAFANAQQITRSIATRLMMQVR